MYVVVWRKWINKQVFGFYLLGGLARSTETQGTRETFVFTIKPDLKKYGWNSEAKNDTFFMMNKTNFSVGGGDSLALFVDEEFHATSDKCITFDNPPLNGKSGTMEIVNVEIWTFE